MKTQVSSLLLTALSLASFTASFPNPANATNVVYSSVRRIFRGQHQSVVESSFQQPDPSFSGSTGIGINSYYTLVPNLASFNNRVNPSFNSGLTGMNIPALHTGLLPNTGDLSIFEAWYSTAGNVSADAGLSYVVQTADGLYHHINFSSVPSQLFNTNNGRSSWSNFFQLINANLASPPLQPSGPGAQVLKMAIVFSGTPGGVNSINQILSPGIAPFGSGNAFNIVAGSTGRLVNNPGGTGYGASLATFSALSHPPDDHFNFELSSGNN